jgi:hypothetical protein
MEEPMPSPSPSPSHSPTITYELPKAQYIKSAPIPITSNIVKDKGHQYCLKNVLFDPTQCSPPSVWKMRLKKRLNYVE